MVKAVELEPQLQPVMLLLDGGVTHVDLFEFLLLITTYLGFVLPKD